MCSSIRARSAASQSTNQFYGVTALLKQWPDIAPFLVESRLGLGEHVVGEVGEPVRAVHALARVAAFGPES